MMMLTRGRVIAATAIVVSLVFVLTTLWVTYSSAPYSPLVMHAGPFAWPAGCVPREYQDEDPISIACHADANRIPPKLVSAHGFPGLIERTEHDYFRVGSEAINFRCNYFTDKCWVRHAEHDVYR